MAKTEILSEGAHRFDSKTITDLTVISFSKCSKESQARQDPSSVICEWPEDSAQLLCKSFIPMGNISPLKVTRVPFLDYGYSLWDA